jgi:threonyl-tRNA synthetase
MNQMLSITLPDGSSRAVPLGTTPADIAAAIGPGLAKAALAARVDGELRDLDRPLEHDAQLALVTARDEKDALELVRHDFAHVLAEAVQSLFPGTQITFGPATDDGFYYDFAPKDRAFTEEDLPAIEAEMRRIIAKDEKLVREVWDRDALIDLWKAQGETFKAEWAGELPQGEELTVYRAGTFLDMCRGPHLPSTGKLDPQAFKLTRVSGAYWRGDQKNAMLSRVYGTGWLNKKQLDAHLTRLEEAAKRDHRKIGQEMDLFHLQAEAHGSVFWHPKGYLIWRQLEAYMRRRLDAAGYDEVKTPQLMDARQWEQSGHWGKYRENMFVVPDEVPSAEDEGPIVSSEADLMALKPMNCPAHVLIFRQGIKSYRDLPIRMAEFGCCHRNEAHGALHGLMRVRQFTQDDAHIFVRADQLIDEVQKFCDLLDLIYKDLGFDSYAIKLALRPEKRFGSEEMWDWAEQSLRDAVAATGRATEAFGWEELPGEGAFYAPKLEFHLTDAIGRTWQAARSRPIRCCPSGSTRPMSVKTAAPSSDDAPPRDPRHVRALHRHPDRASCRPLPALARAGAGGGADDRLGRRRLRRRGGRQAARRRAARRDRYAQREDQLQGARAQPCPRPGVAGRRQARGGGGHRRHPPAGAGRAEGRVGRRGDCIAAGRSDTARPARITSCVPVWRQARCCRYTGLRLTPSAPSCRRSSRHASGAGGSYPCAGRA